MSVIKDLDSSKKCNFRHTEDMQELYKNHSGLCTRYSLVLTFYYIPLNIITHFPFALFFFLSFFFDLIESIVET